MRSYVVALFFTFILSSNCFAKTTYPFEGVVDLKAKTLDVGITLDEKGSIEVKGKTTNASEYSLAFDVKNLKASKLNITSHIETAFKFEEDDGVPFVSGKVWSNYSLVNFKPIRELNGRFVIQDNILRLIDGSFGSIRSRGSINLKPPFKIDAVVNVKALDIDAFLNLWLEERKMVIDGLAYGDLKVDGVLGKFSIKGNVFSDNLLVENQLYNSLQFALDGYYPYIFINNCQVTHSDGGDFSCEGPFDLSEQATYKQQVTDLNIQPIVSKSDSEIEWTLKSVGEEGGAKTEIKYLKRKKSSLDILLGDNEEEGMFGLERVMEF